MISNDPLGPGPGPGPPRVSPPLPGTLTIHAPIQSNDEPRAPALFTDPMMGTPLSMFVEEDVQDRPEVIRLIKENGGVVAPGYSSVPYILVDPKLPSGQSLYRQYAGKKAKLVLAARWVHECVSRGALQGFSHNWAGCRVTGEEEVVMSDPSPLPAAHESAPTPCETEVHSVTRASSPEPVFHNHPLHPSLLPYLPPVFPPPGRFGSLPSQPESTPRYITTLPSMIPGLSWAAQTPSDSDMLPPDMSTPPPHYRPEGWDHYAQFAPPPPPDYHLSNSGWSQPQEHPESQYAPWPPEAPTEPQNGGTQEVPSISVSQPSRGRKRTRVVTQPVTCSSANLVVHRRGPVEPSPPPPARVVECTYGGNVFTDDDVHYLKNYIDYCQRQGLVLSIKEICERVAVKCPHHTFHSWRRYCNKHHIRLGGYALDSDSSSPSGTHAETPVESTSASLSGPEDVSFAESGEQPPVLLHDEFRPQSTAPAVPQAMLPQTFTLPLNSQPGQLPIVPLPAPTRALPVAPPLDRAPSPHPPAPAPTSSIDPALFARRSRSPSPPKALFRSTTGKGVAFTPADVAFLVAFLHHRRARGQLDMVAFWNDVVARCPHHSRASWMKYYRRHKHELFPEDAAGLPPPPPPEKKLRYSRTDDVLLARYQFSRPVGTSDKIFQEFARRHPHHPWKGWQEHARIHKAAIEHLVKCLERGEEIEPSPAVTSGEMMGAVEAESAMLSNIPPV